MSETMAKTTGKPSTVAQVRKDTHDLPLMSREAPVTEVNADDRSIEMVWTTGARVKRYDWYRERYYWEELSLDPAHVRMGRLESGKAPLLNTHSRWSLDDVLGVITSASLTDGRGIASARFSQRESVAEIFQDVRDGIIANVSMGYSIYRFEMIAPLSEGEIWTYRAVDWEPSEISLVPIGADAAAGTRADPGSKPDQQRMSRCEFLYPADSAARSDVAPPAAAGNTQEETVMTDEEKRAAEAAEQTRKQNEERIRKEAQEAEQQRQASIREVVTLGGLDEKFARTLCDDATMTAEAAGLAVLREQAKRSDKTPTRSASGVDLISDEVDVRRARMGDAIALRANPSAILSTDAKENKERKDAAREFRGLNLVEMARTVIEANGGRARGLSHREIATVALNLDHDMRARAGLHSTSDFPLILAGTVNRTLRMAYDLAPKTFEPWTRRTTAPDFKQIARTQLSDISKFQAVNEGGEYKYLSFGESAEKYALSKTGGIIALTWETIINDDLQAFDRVPLALAGEAAATEADVVYGLLSTNAAMSDGTALFHADHGNLPTAAAITDATLGLGRALMRKQTGPKGRLLNVIPMFLVVGPDKEVEANKYTSASFVAAKASDINPNFNTSLTVIVDARISGNKWYLIASPTMIDTIEYAYLEGEEGLFTETKMGFEVDGIMVKARHVFAAKAIDWRGMVYNSGA